NEFTRAPDLEDCKLRARVLALLISSGFISLVPLPSLIWPQHSCGTCSNTYGATHTTRTVQCRSISARCYGKLGASRSPRSGGKWLHESQSGWGILRRVKSSSLYLGTMVLQH